MALRLSTPQTAANVYRYTSPPRSSRSNSSCVPSTGCPRLLRPVDYRIMNVNTAPEPQSHSADRPSNAAPHTNETPAAEDGGSYAIQTYANAATTSKDVIHGSLTLAQLHLSTTSGCGYGTEVSTAEVMGSARGKPLHARQFVIDHLGVGTVTDESLEECFQFFDTEQSGLIDKEEFRVVFRDCFENYGAPMEEKDVQRVFEKFDRNGSGKLTFNEFCIVILSRLKM